MSTGTDFPASISVPIPERVPVPLSKDIQRNLEQRAFSEHGVGYTYTGMQERDGERFAVLVVSRSGLGNMTRASIPSSCNVDSKTDIARFVAMVENDPSVPIGSSVVSVLRTEKVFVLDVLTSREHNVRTRIAKILGVEPWDVQVQARYDQAAAKGDQEARTVVGFTLRIPPSSYVESAHAKKLTELVESDAVGAVGWFYTVNMRTWTLDITKAEPPVFPAHVPFDYTVHEQHFNIVGPECLTIPIGLRLPPNGDEQATPVALRLHKDSPHTLVGGKTSSGKTVFINAVIATLLARGVKIAIVDDPQKSQDFQWCKPFVERGWWGCDGPAQQAAVFAAIDLEGIRRASILEEHGAVNWLELPREHQFPPIACIFDEITTVVNMETEKGFRGEAKDAIVERNSLRSMLIASWRRCLAKWRFAGIYIVSGTQVANATTGFNTVVKGNISNFVLMGSNAEPAQREQILGAADAATPHIPPHIAHDPIAKLGVGVFAVGGSEPGILKTPYTADMQRYSSFTKELEDYLVRLGVPRHDPMASEMDAIEAATVLRKSIEADQNQFSGILDKISLSDGDEDSGSAPVILSDTTTARRRQALEAATFAKEAAEGPVDANGNRLRGAAAANVKLATTTRTGTP